MINYKILILSVLLLVYSKLFSQSIPPFQNWDEQTIEGLEGVSCWEVSSDTKGLYYIATTGGLYQFDGSTLSNLSSAAKMPILKSVLLHHGTIYYSELQKDGYCLFEKNGGSFSFNPFSENTPDQAYSAFSKILTSDSTIYFLTDNYVRVLSRQKKEWEFVKSLSKQKSAVVKGSELYSYKEENGLYILRENDWIRASKKIPDPYQQLLIIELFGQIAAITESTIYFLNSQSGEWKPWTFIKLNGEKPTAFAALDDHTFIIGTDNGSVNTYSRSGRLVNSVILREKPKIRSIHVDSQGRIWIPTTKGLSFFQLNYPVFKVEFSNEKIAKSSIFSITGRDSLLFIGFADDEIIYERLTHNNKARLQGTIKISQLGSPHDLQVQVVANDLFITHVKNGLYYYNPQTQKIENICKGARIRILEMPMVKDKLAVRSVENGLFIIEKKNGSWKFKNTVAKWGLQAPYSSLEDDDNTFWFLDRLENNESILHRVKLNEQLSEVLSDKSYGMKQGLPDKIGRSKLFSIKGSLYISTPSGVYYYKKNSDSFYHNENLSDLIGQDASDILFEDNNNNLWLIPNGKLPSILIKQDNGLYNKYLIPITQQQKRILDQYFLDSGIALLGTMQGIVGVNPKFIEQNQIQVNISRIYSTSRKNDSIQFHSPNSPIQLPILRNSLHFRLSSNHFIQGTQVEYQYRLREDQTEWSAWTTNPLISFPNLSDGAYVFEARSKDPFGKISESVFFSFKIHPPWYRTIWAYIIYLLLLSAAVIAFVRWRVYVIKRYNAELEIEVASRTEEIVVQKEFIEAQAKELARLNELKTRFLTETAHELRTPLTLTLAPLYDVLERKEQLSEDTLDQLRISEKNGRKLLELIEEILTVSRLENATLPSRQSIAFPERVIRDLVECYNPFFIEKRIKISYNFQIRPDLCLGLDWSKYRKIVSNLIHNAIKFTPDQGEIMVNIQLINADTSQLLLETIISDTGEGIPKHELENIFLRFYKQNDAKEGFGIGLSLVKDLVELMSGTIEVSSELTKGSTFILRVPTKLEVPVEYPIVEFNGNNSANQFKHKNILLPKDEQIAKVVVVEDNDELRSYLSKMLKQHYEVIDFESAYKALDWLRFNTADLIISDWMMSGMDGMGFYDQLKSNQALRLIPFILLTAKAGAEQRMEALMLGVDEYITKPFAPKELMMRISRLLDLKVKRVQAVNEETPETEEDFSLQEKFVKKFKDFVEAHMGETAIKLTDLCEALAVSERQLHYKVKSLTGMTPGNLVREIKLQHVRRLFEKNQLGTVAEGAYTIGFNNINHFSKLFEKRFGKKPSTYFKESGLHT